MKKIKLVDAIILFVGLGFIVMFVDQVIYKKGRFSDSYFFLMFGIGAILTFLYRRGNQILKENDQKGKKK